MRTFLELFVGSVWLGGCELLYTTCHVNLWIALFLAVPGMAVGLDGVLRDGEGRRL